MRLKENQIKHICHDVLVTLRSNRQITLKKGEKEVLSRMEAIFVAELKVEDDINREAEALLEKYARQAGGNIDREKMFQMIKKQLIKDKKVVI